MILATSPVFLQVRAQRIPGKNACKLAIIDDTNATTPDHLGEEPLLPISQKMTGTSILETLIESEPS